jgi:predicted MFS family arabinose efflux permease
MMAAGFVVSMTAPIELLYARRLGAGAVALAIYIAVPGAGVLVVDVLGTRFVPRLDARAALATGVLLFGVSGAALGASPGFLGLIPARALQGLGSGLLLGAALQAAVRVDTDRERALGGFNSAFLLGAALGAPAGGLLTGLVPGTAGYRVTFGICALVSGVVAVSILAALPPLPPVLGVGLATIGLPRFSGGPGIGLALILGMLGDFLRGGVVYTLLPLAGQARHLSTATIGVAIGLLSGVEILTMRNSARLFRRFGIVPCLLAALGIGVAIASSLALATGRTAFVAGAFVFGVVLAGATVAPQLVIVALHDDDPASGLASYRISSSVGMVVGSTGAGAAVAAIGASGVFVAVAGVMAGGVGLAYGVGRRLARPSSA